MNTQAQHTPGPWQVNDRNGYQVCDADGEQRGCAPIAIMRGTNAEKRANARLIAAAPDQNASLIELLAEDVLFAWVNETGIGKAEYQRRSAILERARAALAKATQA